MKTIAELNRWKGKLERCEGLMEKCNKCRDGVPCWQHRNYLKWSGMIKGYHILRQSLSQMIEQDVAGCEEVIRRWYKEGKKIIFKIELCREFPPAQKCDGCKRLLKLKKENLEG